MSHYQPNLISEDQHISINNNADDRNTSEDDAESLKVQLCKLQLKHLHEPVLIFDLNANVTVMIGDVPVPSQIFDYLNPLLLHVDSDIYFYKQQELLSEITCYRLYCNADLNKLRSSIVYYPPNYYIDYTNYKVNRNGNQEQFWEQILPKMNTPFINISQLPFLNDNSFALEGFRQMLEALSGSDQIRMELLSEDELEEDSYE